MKCLISPYTNIYSNLALEEYLLMKKTNDFFILWKAGPSVVVGKHQNALAEVNLRFANRHGIQIARRLSGGGTVFHDEGNLNFTFIRAGEPGKLVDFGRFIHPVIGFLDTLHIQAVQGKKNEILTGGKKISGNAEHVFKNRVMHHGTLLFNANLSLLKGSLNVQPGRYRDKAVQSNRSEVTNLAERLGGMELPLFSEAFFTYMHETQGGESFELTDADQDGIGKLELEKYRKWEWIFGWSPDYELDTIVHAGDICLEVTLQVHRGIITRCSMRSQQDHHLANNLEQAMQGVRHEPSELGKVWDTFMPAMSGEEKMELVYRMF